jgi:hypothetical protein
MAIDTARLKIRNLHLTALESIAKVSWRSRLFGRAPLGHVVRMVLETIAPSTSHFGKTPQGVGRASGC